eukprot:6187563-Pleurochrysis_carterae.AAC.6
MPPHAADHESVVVVLLPDATHARRGRQRRRDPPGVSLAARCPAVPARLAESWQDYSGVTSGARPISACSHTSVIG